MSVQRTDVEIRSLRDALAMLFHSVKGFSDASVVIGVLASRARVARLLGCAKEDLGKLLCECVAEPLEPVIDDAPAPCQEVVHRAEDPDFDLRRLIPAPTNTPVDAGPYITLGMCYATHPDTGRSDVTIHRLCVQGRDELSIFLQPGSRHIGAMAERCEELGVPLPITVSIGVDPAIEITSCFEPPTTPLGFNELSIAGALRKKPVELTPCVTIHENAIANAEYVIEGEILPGSNNTVEDLAFCKLGADAYLVTDYLLDPVGLDLATVKHGSAQEFADWVDALPACAHPVEYVCTGPVDSQLTDQVLDSCGCLSPEELKAAEEEAAAAARFNQKVAGELAPTPVQ